MRKLKLWMNDIVFDGDNILFSAGQFNGLFKANIYEGEAELINSFPHELRTQVRLHSAAIKYKDEILFLPDLANEITLYNLKTNSFECLKFPYEEEQVKMPNCPKIIAAVLIDSYVYAFGSRYPIIIRYDFEKRQIKVYDEWIEAFKAYGYKEDSSFFCYDICKIGDSLFARTYQNDLIVEFNPMTENISFHQMGKSISRILCGSENKIWLFAEKDMCINAWHVGDNLMESTKLLHESNRDRQRFHCSIDLQNEIWLFSYFMEPILIIDKNSMLCKEMNLTAVEANKRNQNSLLGAVWFRKLYNDKLYFMSVLENKLYCFTDSEREEFSNNIYADRAKIKTYLLHEKRLEEQGIVTEQESNFLWGVKDDFGDWLDISVLQKINTQKHGKAEAQAGKKIYDLLINRG